MLTRLGLQGTVFWTLHAFHASSSLGQDSGQQPTILQLHKQASCPRAQQVRQQAALRSPGVQGPLLYPQKPAVLCDPRFFLRYWINSFSFPGPQGLHFPHLGPVPVGCTAGQRLASLSGVSLGDLVGGLASLSLCLCSEPQGVVVMQK